MPRSPPAAAAHGGAGPARPSRWTPDGRRRASSRQSSGGPRRPVGRVLRRQGLGRINGRCRPRPLQPNTHSIVRPGDTEAMPRSRISMIGLMSNVDGGAGSNVTFTLRARLGPELPSAPVPCHGRRGYRPKASAPPQLERGLFCSRVCSSTAGACPQPQRLSLWQRGRIGPSRTMQRSPQRWQRGRSRPRDSWPPLTFFRYAERPRRDSNARHPL
jgi:hypothetical protein